MTAKIKPTSGLYTKSRRAVNPNKPWQN